MKKKKTEYINYNTDKVTGKYNKYYLKKLFFHKI